MYIYLMLFSVMLYLVDSVKANKCSEYNPIPDIVKCLSNITHGLNKTNVLAGTETKIIRLHCDDGSFQSSIRCLEHLYRVKDECASSKNGLHMLMRDNMPRILKQSVKDICSNLQEHAKYSDCIVSNRPLIQDCLHRNDVFFQQTQASNTMPTVESIAENMCKYYRGLEACTGKFVENRCDKNVGVLIGHFISTLNPLNCGTSDAVILHNGNHIYCINAKQICPEDVKKPCSDPFCQVDLSVCHMQMYQQACYSKVQD